MTEVKVSGPAYEALVLAQEEARRLNHSYIGTEHVLLGLLRVPESQAAKALHALGTNLAMVRVAVEFIIGRGQRAPAEEVQLTPRAEQAVGLAMEQALQADRTCITTADLLVALLREEEGVAAGVLESQGISISRVACLNKL